MGGACGKWAAVLVAVAGACGGGGGGETPDAAARVDALHRPDSARVDGAPADGSFAATDVFEVATGTGAPLSGSLPEGSGSDLDFRATLGPGHRVLVNDDDSRVWLCFAPDPPQFTTYNVTTFGESATGTFYFDIAIPPEQWAVGEVAIDGTNVAAFVGDHGPDKATIGAVAIGGTLTLSAAPTTLGEPCAFALHDVPVAVVAPSARE